MAGFKTHITTSSILGVGYGAAALTLYDAPLPACILAGGLCGVSGMLPDLDSASGVPKRESIAFAAAVVPLLMAERFKRMGMPAEYIVLLGGFMYLFIRFGVAKMLTRFTVHRGMFHSLPACLIAGEIAFLISGHENIWQRYFNGAAVMLGFMSHLVLDEIWSLDFQGGRIRFKSSFGTAMKFWGESMGSNVLTYAGVAILSFMALEDPVVLNQIAPAESQQVADQPGDRLMK
jgi:hypothetical protein